MTDVQGRGYGLLFLSVALNAGAFHASKAALAGSTPLLVSLLIQVSATVGFIVLGAVWRHLDWSVGELQEPRWSTLAACFSRCRRVLLVAPVLVAFNGWLVNLSIGRYGAEMTAFLMNLTLVFLVLAGLVAGERPRRAEIAAIVTMVGGAFLFSYRGGAFAWGALAVMAAACALMAGKQLLVKHLAGRAPLPVAMCAVMGLGALWTAVLLTAGGGWQATPWSSVGWAVAAGLMGSVAGMFCLYQAYLLVGVTRGAPFDALRPLAVLAMGLGLGHALPGLPRLAGGGLILAGSVALIAMRQSGAGRPRISGQKNLEMQ